MTRLVLYLNGTIFFGKLSGSQLSSGSQEFFGPFMIFVLDIVSILIEVGG